MASTFRHRIERVSRALALELGRSHQARHRPMRSRRRETHPRDDARHSFAIDVPAKRHTKRIMISRSPSCEPYIYEMSWMEVASAAAAYRRGCRRTPVADLAGPGWIWLETMGQGGLPEPPIPPGVGAGRDRRSPCRHRSVQNPLRCAARNGRSICSASDSMS